MNPDDTVYRGRIRDIGVTTYDNRMMARFTIDVPILSIDDGKHLAADECALSFQNDE